ncbi:MAG: quercetin 2,3-dioxygenase [Chloroflexi bacterium]|nr:quercetin 2,3-dioxygenase [Chloroflexota bacterium]
MTQLFPDIPEPSELSSIPGVESPEQWKDGLLVPPGEGEAVWLLDELITFKLGMVETNQAFSLLEASAGPGGGPPLHVHYQAAEAFYMLDGAITLMTGRLRRRVTQGSFVHIPSGVPHTYRVDGRSPARLLLLYAPAGHENFFREIGEPARIKVLPPNDHLPDMQRYVQGLVKYGSEILGAPLGPG